MVTGLCFCEMIRFLPAHVQRLLLLNPQTLHDMNTRNTGNAAFLKKENTGIGP